MVPPADLDKFEHFTASFSCSTWLNQIQKIINQCFTTKTHFLVSCFPIASIPFEPTATHFNTVKHFCTWSYLSACVYLSPFFTHFYLSFYIFVYNHLFTPPPTPSIIKSFITNGTSCIETTHHVSSPSRCNSC